MRSISSNYIHICYSVHSLKPRIFNDYIKYLGVFINFTFIIFLPINPNPLYQLFLSEETGESGENPRLSVECWQTLPTCDHMFDTEIEPMASVVGGRHLHDYAI